MIKDKKLQVHIVTLLLLCLGLCITSIAVSYTLIKVENNYFKTGEISIDLNGGQPIIPADKWLLEPGMTIQEDFTITNKGGWKVYYKLFFEKVEGKLGEVLEIDIFKKDSPDIILLSGKISELVDADALNIAGELEEGETQILTARFHFPKDSGNDYKGEALEFDMSAIAVQTKNNSNKEFK